MKKPLEVTLYAVANSKSSTHNRTFWFWSTQPSLYARANKLPIYRTRNKVDISDLPYVETNGDYKVTVKNKSLQRKLIEQSTVL